MSGIALPTSKADFLTGTAGADSIAAGAGNDTVAAGAGADTILGEAGNDSIFSGDGDDFLDGGTNDDALYGGDGADTLFGGANQDVLFGDAGNDSLDGGANSDTLNGGSGDDTLAGGDADDWIFGGAGADRISGGRGADTIDGGDGVDEVVYAGPRSRYEITANADRSIRIRDLIGGSSNEGSDLLFNVELLRFSDGVISFTANAAPIARADLVTLRESDLPQSVSANVLSNDTDPDGDLLRVQSMASGSRAALLSASDSTLAGAFGSVTVNETGAYTYVLLPDAVQSLAEGQVVEDVFTYVVVDGRGGAATQTLRITIIGTNDAPVVSGAVTGTATEDGATVSLSALANASDVDSGAVLSVVNLPSTLPAGVSYDSVARTFTLDPTNAAYQSLAAGASIVVTVNYGVSDGMATTSASVSWTVIGTNDAPVVAAGDVQAGTLAERADGAPDENAGMLTTAGSFAFTDADLTDTHVVSQVLLSAVDSGTGAATAARGHLEVSIATVATGGGVGSIAWTYTVAAGALDGLAEGQAVTQVYRVSVADSAGATVTKDVTITLTGSNDEAVIGGASAGAVAEDGSLTASGTLSISDPDTGQAGFRMPSDLAGIYGSFSFDAATGAWSYALDNAAAKVQALAAGQTVDDTLTVVSLDGSAREVITARITGANDAASITGTATGSVTEDGMLMTGDTLAITDADAGQAVFRVPASLTGSYGSFSFDAATGVWGYALDNAAAHVQALAAGQTVSDTLTVVSLDGSASQALSVTIIGTNDAASITGTASGKVIEDETLTTGGVLTVSDADAGQAVFQTPASLVGTYGSFTFDAATGVWGYALDNAAAHVQALAAGQTVTDTLTVVSLDGSASQAITVTVTGANDTAVIGGTATGVVTEDGTLAASGALTLSGASAGQALFQVPVSLAGVYGSFSFDAATGAWSYALDNAAAKVQALAAGQTVSDALTVTSLDGSASQAITVTVAGTNDTAVIGGTTLGAVAEDGTITASGTLSISNADAGQAVFQMPASLVGLYGTFSFDAATGAWRYALDNTAAKVQALVAGRTVNDTLTVTSLDGTATQAITVTVAGRDDAASITGTATGSVTEDGTLTTGGALAITDADAGQAVFRVPASLAGGYGGFSFDAVTGVWGYALDNAAAHVQALAAGQTVTDTLTVVSLDGSASQAITVTITGANDAASITGTATGKVIEDETLTTGGVLTVGDADAGEAVFQTPASLVGIYGSFTFDAATGLWGYALDNAAAHVQALAAGQRVTDRLVVASIDGSASQAIAVTITGWADPVPAINLGVIAAGTGGFKIIGETSGDGAGGEYGGRAGFAVSSIADLNGDGLAEILVSASMSGSSLLLPAAAYVVWGKADGMPIDLGAIALGDGGFKIIGEDGSAYGGWYLSVSSIGDLNGDGLSEILVGDRGDAANGIAAGAAYVVWGTSDHTLIDLGTVALGHGGFKIVGENVFDFAGGWVSSIGDLDGDGLSEILVGAAGNGAGGLEAGAAYVVWGKADGTPVNLGAVALGNGGFKIVGEEMRDLAGVSVSSIGDLNGDGLPEILLGAYYNNVNGLNFDESEWGAGAAYVVWGKADGASVDLDAVAQGIGGFKIIGENAYDGAGVSVTAIGDLNGDGWTDILVSAEANSPAGRDMAGAAYVVWGKADNMVIDLAAIAQGTGGFKILGEISENANWSAGFASSAIGDLNGDGRPDLLLGVASNGAGGPLAGAAYVVWGKADGTPVDLAAVALGIGGFKIVGENAFDMAGISLSSIGDLNGDGRPEIVVGAFLNDAGGGAAELPLFYGDGAAYIVFSSAAWLGDSMRIAGVASGAVAEDGIPGATGMLTVTTPAGDAAGFAAGFVQTGTYGSFNFDVATGVWDYALNNAAANVQALRAGQTATDVLTVTSLDGSAIGAVTVTIAGANDAASITGPATGEVTEDGTLVQFGTLALADPDMAQAVFRTPALLAGTYGAFAFDVATGDWSYTLDNTAAQVQALVTGQTVTDTLTVVSRDGTAMQSITVSIAGLDDIAVIDGAAGGDVIEDGTLTAGGVLAITDPDAGQAVFRTPTSLAGTYGSFSFDAATGAWSYALDNAAAHVQALVDGETVTDTLTVTSLDGTATQAVTVTIAGANDVASITGTATGAVTEDGTLMASGVLAINDADAGQGVFQSPASLLGLYGSFSFDATTGAWTYVLDNAAAEVQALAAGEAVTDTLTVTALDGSASQDITVTIGGANDLAGITGTATGSVIEDATLTTGGVLTISDADEGQAVFRVPASLAGGYGGFSFEAVTGVWRYALDNAAAHVQALAAGQTVTDTLTVVSLDGSASQAITVTITGQADPIPAVNLGAIAAGAGGFKIIGEAAGDTAGESVSSIGDLNGDGIPEILVAAPGSRAGGTTASAAYVVWGKADGAAVNLGDVALGHGGFKILGENGAGYFVTAVSSIGDLNGDGRPEILVAAPGIGAQTTGAAYVVWGKADGAAVDLGAVALGDGGFRILGEYGTSYGTFSVSSIADLNGDGRPEILLGTFGTSTGAAGTGAGYVVWGKADGPAVELDAVALGHGGFKILGESAEDYAGASVSSIGDLNGDGLAEILVSAYGNDAGGLDAGATYVVWGKADGAAVDLATVALGDGGFKIIGENSLEYAGWSVSSIGDLNGDDRPDILVGVDVNGSVGQSNQTVAYVVWGKPDGAAVDLAAIAQGSGGFKISGEAGYEFASYSVSSIGDLNGDDRDDLLIGAERSSPLGNSVGSAAYVVWGKADGSGVHLDAVARGVGGFKLSSDIPDDFAGFSLSAVGDLNGDGRPEILVSAERDDTGGADAGAAYVVFSSSSWLFNG